MQQQQQFRSVQEWLQARRDGGRVLADPELRGTAHWASSGRMPRPPATAYGGDDTQAAGAKFVKGFPASMQLGGPPKTPVGRASFAQQFAAANPYATMPALKAVTHSMRTDAQRLAVGTPSPAPARGIQKQVLRAGDGATATNGDVVSVNYVGWLAGSSPESAFDQGRDFRFGVGMGDVIPGWDEVVCGMREGEVSRVLIPSNLAYGARGSPPQIPPHADLCFEILLGGVLTGGTQPSTQPTAAPPRATDDAPADYSDDPPAFLPAARFAGARAGMSFKTGPHGLGYYRDPLAPRSSAPTPAAAATDALRTSVKFEQQPPGQSTAPQRPSVPSYAVSAAPVAANYAARSFAGQGAFTRRSFAYM